MEELLSSCNLAHFTNIDACSIILIAFFILAFRILLASSIIRFYWEAMLLSFLTVEITNLPYTDIASLIDDSDDKLAIKFGTAYEDIFKLSKVCIHTNYVVIIFE